MAKQNPLDELRPQIAAIQKGVDQLRKTGVREQVLLLLIQRASPMIGVPPRYPAIGAIKAVLEGMASLEEYVFGEDDG